MIDLNGLKNISRYLSEETVYKFSEIETAYFIRQLGIASGCGNQCIHCFADAPITITQTSLNGFSRIIKEIGHVIKSTGKNLDFFHLGADTDPMYIANYADYLSTWIKSFPATHPIKIFTHCWNLFGIGQKSELKNTLDVIKGLNATNVKFVISFDEFSLLARRNWDRYLDNVAQNLSAMVDCVGKDRVRIEVFYMPETDGCDSPLRLQYWRDVLMEKSISAADIHKEIPKFSGGSNNARKTTLGVLHVFDKAGLTSQELIAMSRDCGIIFPAGRGLNLFDSDQQRKNGLDTQKRNVLYSLNKYEHRFEGVIIYPDGSVRLVDYEGFKLGKWLNNGKPIVNYMETV